MAPDKLHVPKRQMKQRRQTWGLETLIFTEYMLEKQMLNEWMNEWMVSGLNSTEFFFQNTRMDVFHNNFIHSLTSFFIMKHKYQMVGTPRKALKEGLQNSLTVCNKNIHVANFIFKTCCTTEHNIIMSKSSIDLTHLSAMKIPGNSNNKMNYIH